MGWLSQYPISDRLDFCKRFSGHCNAGRFVIPPQDIEKIPGNIWRNEDAVFVEINERTQKPNVTTWKLLLVAWRPPYSYLCETVNGKVPSTVTVINLFQVELSKDRINRVSERTHLSCCLYSCCPISEVCPYFMREHQSKKTTGEVKSLFSAPRILFNEKHLVFEYNAKWKFALLMILCSLIT